MPICWPYTAATKSDERATKEREGAIVFYDTKRERVCRITPNELGVVLYCASRSRTENVRYHQYLHREQVSDPVFQNDRKDSWNHPYHLPECLPRIIASRANARRA